MFKSSCARLAYAKKVCLFAIILSCLLVNAAQATLMKYLEIEELTKASTEVVSGQVLSTQSYWDESRTRIYTDVRVQINECLRGKSKRGQIVTLKQLGGELDGQRLDFSGRPSFTVGESVVLFAKAATAGKLTVVGLKQGKLRLVGNEVQRDFAGISLVDTKKMSLKLTNNSLGGTSQAKTIPTISSTTVQTRLSLDELRARVARVQ